MERLNVPPPCGDLINTVTVINGWANLIFPQTSTDCRSKNNGNFDLYRAAALHRHEAISLNELWAEPAGRAVAINQDPILSRLTQPTVTDFRNNFRAFMVEDWTAGHVFNGWLLQAEGIWHAIDRRTIEEDGSPLYPHTYALPCSICSSPTYCMSKETENRMKMRLKGQNKVLFDKMCEFKSHKCSRCAKHICQACSWDGHFLATRNTTPSIDGGKRLGVCLQCALFLTDPEIPGISKHTLNESFISHREAVSQRHQKK